MIPCSFPNPLWPAVRAAVDHNDRTLRLSDDFGPLQGAIVHCSSARAALVIAGLINRQGPVR